MFHNDPWCRHFIPLLTFIWGQLQQLCSVGTPPWKSRRSWLFIFKPPHPMVQTSDKTIPYIHRGVSRMCFFEKGKVLQLQKSSVFHGKICLPIHPPLLGRFTWSNLWSKTCSRVRCRSWLGNLTPTSVLSFCLLRNTTKKVPVVGVYAYIHQYLLTSRVIFQIVTLWYLNGLRWKITIFVGTSAKQMVLYQPPWALFDPIAG